MFFMKSVPKGLKYLECECGIEGINSPIHSIPEQDLQDTLKKKNKTTYFKMTLPKRE